MRFLELTKTARKPSSRSCLTMNTKRRRNLNEKAQNPRTTQIRPRPKKTQGVTRMNIDENVLIEKLKSIKERLEKNDLLEDEDDMVFAVTIAIIEEAARKQGKEELE